MQVEDYEIYLHLIENRKYSEATDFKNSKIPNSLFKYYSFNNDNPDSNNSKIEYLKVGKVYLSTLNPSPFNDPFEGKFLKFNEKELKHKKWDRDLIEEYYTSLVKKWYVSCLSNTSEQNMPMWAYYANNHSGFCVKYEFTDRQKKYIFPVKYEEKRQYADSIITRILNNMYKIKAGGKLSGEDHVLLQVLFLSMAAKHISWSHEMEYRIICNEAWFPALAKEIYIGIYCESTYIKQIVKIAGTLNGYCKVYQMKFDRDNPNFELQKEILV